MVQAPEDHMHSPIGVAVSPDGTPWTCVPCSIGISHVDAPGCPGAECLCGHNEHGRNVVTLDGGVRMMPEFSHIFGWKYAHAVVRIDTDPER
jgi:hypothetical protein